MFRPTNLRIDTKCLGKHLLVDVKTDVKDGEQVGYKYLVALPDHQLDKYNVRIPGKQQINASDGICEVVFENLQVRPYVIDGVFGLTATATAVRRVDTQNK